MRPKSYQEERQEIELFNKKLAEATFHGQIEVFYIEKFEDPSALYRELRDEYGSRLSKLDSLKMMLSHADYEDELRSIKKLSSRKDKLARDFYPLIKGRVIRIFRGDGRVQFGDSLSFKRRANFGNFIPIGSDQPVWEYERLSNSKFMEILLNDGNASEKSLLKRFASLTTEIDEPTSEPIFKKIVSEESVKLNQPQVIEGINKRMADAGLQVQVEVIERVKSLGNLTELIKGRVIRIFLNDEPIQIGDEIDFEALAGSSKAAAAEGDDSTHKISGERKYMEVLFNKEQAVSEGANPTLTRPIEAPTDYPVLIKLDLPPEPPKHDPLPEPPKFHECPRCRTSVPVFIKFCARCGLKL